jgi:UDP-N-acetylglucosamine diphosphorylase/glucosamine-1-phosphate N-acetyltransferase
MNVILFDNATLWENLLPLTFTRPVSEIRFGILTIKEKWDRHLETNCAYLTKTYLSDKFQFVEQSDTLFIQSNYCPNQALVKSLKQLRSGQGLYQNQNLIAFRGVKNDLKDSGKLQKISFEDTLIKIENVWDLFQGNGEAIKADFELLADGRNSNPLSNSVTVIGDRNKIFVETGALAEACILNTKAGPIYIGKNAEIMEGAAIRGPFALGENSVIKLNAKIYGPTTVGPHSKVGGEVNNCVIFGYSNKAHDGFIGNSVIGEWCNLGADTNSSNLKNNYANVKLFNYLAKSTKDTGLQFCGLIMADHSKSGINAMFNTGTVVGVGANVFGAEYPPTHIPSFSWGGASGLETYRLEKLFETAQKIFERRSLVFGEKDRAILKHVFQETAEYRND